MDFKEKIENITKRMRPMDYMILAVCAFIIVIFLFIFIGKKVYSPTPIVNEGRISYDIFFKNVLLTSNNGVPHNPFHEGDETFVTIRNVPHAKLKIINVKYERKKHMLPVGSSYKLVEDEENPCSYDFIITVEDHAKLTDDGAVSGGNKIKIGLPITLEAADYRLNGIVSSLEILDLKNEEDE